MPSFTDDSSVQFLSVCQEPLAGPCWEGNEASQRTRAGMVRTLTAHLATHTRKLSMPERAPGGTHLMENGQLTELVPKDEIPC